MNPTSFIIKNPMINDNIGIYKCKKKIYFNELHEIQSQARSYINKCFFWNKLKMKNENNLYNKKNDSNNIIKLDICSRSYLKLIEMCQKFDLCQEKNINYLAIAEAPGGFIEAFIKLRKNKFMGRNDNIVTISLIDKNNDVPKYIFKNKHNFNIIIFKGAKNNGDLYDIDNIISINEVLDEKYNFITADGGLDFSTNYNNQEELIFKLLFIEMITAFIYLKKDGTFILKIFDILNQNTIELIYIISIFFKKVVVYKPFLSRNSNSEKYLICTNFKGITTKQIDKLKVIYKIIQENDISQYSFINKLPNIYIQKIYEYNKYIIGEQIKNIFKTILEVNNYINILNNFNWCKLYLQHYD